MTQDERFDRIDANIERLSERLESCMVRLDRLTEFVLDFRQETAQRLEVIDNRLDVFSAMLATLESRFPPFTKAILDFGKTSTQLTNEQIKNKHGIAALAARADRLEETVSKLIQPAA